MLRQGPTREQGIAELANVEDQPLTGLRVLELSSIEGQYCGKLLADMGADVVTIEPPGGSVTRRVGPFAGDLPDVNRSLPFWYFNTSKRAITLDIEAPEGQSLLQRLVVGADIVVEGFRPGYLNELRLGYDVLSNIQPRLIQVSITPFGQTGPWSDLRSADLVSLALAGTMAMNGYDDRPGSPPIRPDGNHAYLMGSEYGFIAVLIALLEREAGGTGEWLDISIHEACAGTTEGSFANWEYFQRVVMRQTGRHAQANPTQPWQHRTVDGRYVNLMGGGIPRMYASWRPLVEWMQRHGKAGDLPQERFEAVVHRSPAQRTDADTMHVLGLLARFVEGLDAEEVYREGQARRLPWAIVRAPEENVEDPHWRDRGFFVDVHHPQLGESVTFPGGPYRFSRTPWRIRQHAPLVGEHNVQILQGELGLGREQLRELFEQGII
jgi:crotonobetainyl-CoA:carnitine CoA-transferase CaiB-like acyl-CoA transferase